MSSRFRTVFEDLIAERALGEAPEVVRFREGVHAVRIIRRDYCSGSGKQPETKDWVDTAPCPYCGHELEVIEEIGMVAHLRTGIAITM